MNTHVYNDKCTSTSCADGSDKSMGTVNHRGISYDSSTNTWNGTDTEVFTGCDGTGTCGGSDLIFTGAIGNRQIAVVSGKGSWAVGNQVCVSGAYGGEVCGLSVQQVNYCKTFIEGGEYLDLCHLTRTSGSTVPVSGDSGAPVFRFIGSSLYGVGTHTAHDGSGHEWFTGINAILNKWGATLITG